MVERCLSFEQFQKTKRPGVKWLVHGLIPKPGRFLLVGLPKVGKSNLALQIALAVSQGRPFLGAQVEKGRVLFLQFDATDFEWKDRFDTLKEAGVDISGDNLVVAPEHMQLPFNTQNLQHQVWLQGLLESVNPDLVVIDVLRELHSADEDSSTEMKNACTPLFDILRPYSALILHHTTKLQEGQDYDPIKAARGSGYISGAVSAIGLLHNKKLRVKSRLAGELELRGHMNDIGLWVFDDDNERSVEIREALLREVAAHPGMSGHQLFQEFIRPKFGISRSSFFRKVGAALHARREGGRGGESTTCEDTEAVPRLAVP